MAGVGAAAGLALAVTTNRVMAILLYSISAFDLPAYAGAIVITLALATAACVLPAWRAAQADPGAVLKSE